MEDGVAIGGSSVGAVNSESSTAAHKVRLVALDGLRGIGTLLVVFGHAFDGRDGMFWLPTLMDFFFIYSGFFISRNLLRAPQTQGTIIRFYWRRTLRIWPLYFTVVVAALFLNAWMLSRHLGPRQELLPAAILRYLTFTQYSPAYWGGSELPGGILEHTWSLAVEEQFYVFAPWLLLLIGVRPRSGFGLLAVLAVLSILFRLHGLDTYLFATRLDSFALGIGLGWLSLSKRLLSSPATVGIWRMVFSACGLLWLGIILDGYRDIALGRPIDYIGFNHRFGAALAAKLFYTSVIAGIVLNPGARAWRVFRHPWWTYAGRNCFAIYMIHYPVLLFGASALMFLSGRSHTFCALLMVPLALILARQWSHQVDSRVERWMSTRIGGSFGLAGFSSSKPSLTE